MARPVRDPIPAQPFLDWCERRRKQIERELNCVPAIKTASGRNDFGAFCGPNTRLVMELGWGDRLDTGARRLHRIRYGDAGNAPSGVVSRALVEDALWRAGVAFEDVYPDVDREMAVAS